MEPSVLEQAMQALCESDRQILRLLALRQQLASQLGRAWIQQGKSVALEERLAEVVSRLKARNPGPLDDASLARVFEMVIQATEPLLASISTGNGGGKRG